MPFEADLARALDRTTDALEPDLNALLVGVVEQGRSRRRRRSAAFLGGATACAVIATGGVLAPGLLAGTPATQRVQSAQPGPSAASGVRTKAVQVTGTEMINALETSFGGNGRFTQPTSQSNDPANPGAGLVANAALTYDDGHGAGTVGVSVLQVTLPVADADGAHCEAADPPTAGSTCTMSDLPSSAVLPGGALVMYQRAVDKDPAGRTLVTWQTTLTVKSTGVQLVFGESNGTTTGSTRTVSRATPPFSEQQVLAGLSNAAWTPVLDSFAGATYQYPVSYLPLSDAVVGVLQQLLSPGIAATTTVGGTAGSAWAVLGSHDPAAMPKGVTVSGGGMSVAGGPGAPQIPSVIDLSVSQLDLNASDPNTAKADQDALQSDLAGTTPAPGGWYLTVKHDGSGSKVTAVRKDGLEVSVVEQLGAPSKGPQLTLAQLQAIATASQWESAVK